MIAIVDYGAGNLRSVENALCELGATYTLVRDPAALQSASKIVLPGVGHFGHMMEQLQRTGLRQALLDRIAGGVPFLGICLGLHALFEASEEAPPLQGFGLVRGRICRFPSSARVPQMGWNRLEPLRESLLLKNVVPGSYVYFAHSYYAPVTAETVAQAFYCVPFTAVLEVSHLFGTQFHPEKSGPVGLQILRNFLKL